MSDTNASSAPAIRGFQFDSGAIGNLKNSVNLFRGDVNFHQNLISLTARPGKKELNVDISIFYQSNVHQLSQQWNRNGATGSLGMGWGLPLEEIGLENPDAITESAKAYYYASSGSRNSLVRELGPNPYRFSMSTTYTPVSGSAIGTDIQQQFESNGIPIDAQAIATDNGTGGWTITDSTNLQLFEINSINNELQVTDGGESYQLQNYSFWKILHYPIFERWIVVKESGVTYSYGGYNPSTNKNKNGYNTSLRNTVQWGVCWTDPTDITKAIWIGSSSVDSTNTQMQYAKNWRLGSITDRWGDHVDYAYNEFGPDGSYSSYSTQWRDTTADLLPVVEQQVGTSGLPYTKANYITSITDSFGRKIIFNYSDKDYTPVVGSSNSSAAREYLDPHRDLTQRVIASTPSTYPAPNAYQDTYETKYLASVDVQSPSGAALFAIQLCYEPVTTSYAGYATTDRLYGDTVKRQLSGMTQLNELGQSLLQGDGPELAFDYYAASENNPGALDSITYPDGGIATYTYDKIDLDICQRKITITPPTILGGSASPRLFYGQDYVVSLWTNASLTKLSMRVYTWLGHWEVWELSDPTNQSLLYNNSSGTVHVSGLSGNLLNVTVGNDFFVVHFSDSKQVQAYAFTKDAAKPGQWVPYETASGSMTAANIPSATWPDSSRVSFQAGGSWFLALEQTAGQKRNLSRFTYRWTAYDSGQWSSQLWTEESIISASPDTLYLGTTTDGYLTLSYSGSTLVAGLTWLDPQLNWQTGGSQTINNVRIPQTNNALLVLGQSFAVFSNQTKNPSPTSIFYDVRVFQWTEDYEFVDVKWNGGADSTTTPLSMKDRIGKKSATPSFIPNVVGNSLFGCAGNIFRFDGQTWWTRTENDGLPVDNNASYLHFGYGEDYAVQGWVDNKIPKGNLIAYDPNTNGGANQWNALKVDVLGLPSTVPPYDPGNANNATAGGSDYLTVGTNVYYRGSAANWDTEVSSAGYTITPATGFQINTGAIGNQAPSFISYFEYKQGALAGSTVGALVLRNGQVDPTLSQPQAFSGERYYTALENSGSGSPGNGLTPYGPDSLATYPDTAAGFQTSQSFFLYRYAAQGLTGVITHRPVVSIEIADGFDQTNNVAYAYDRNSAGCDPSGNVVKYFKATTYPGTSDPANFANGYNDQHYINGLVSLEIDNIPQDAVISWNDGGNEQSYTATQPADSTTINNVTDTVLQSMTLNTPSAVMLSFIYGTTEFQEQYNTTGAPVAMFSILPTTPIDYFQMLDGLLWKANTYKSEGNSATLIQEMTNTWQPYTHIAGNLVDGTIPDIPLKGGLVLQTMQTSVKDGTQSSETTSYIPSGFTAPTSGQIISKTQQFYNGDGVQTASEEISTFGYEKYASFRNLHFLNTPVQTVTTINSIVSIATADVYGSATATTGALVPGKTATFKFASGSFSPFPFDSYSAADPATWTGWLRNNLIVARNAQGLVVTSKDAMGISHSLLYDALQQYTVATASNAHFSTTSQDTVMSGLTYATGEAAYTGFESYEDMAGWNMANGASLYPSGGSAVSDCHTGDRSLQLPNGGTLSRNFTPDAGNQKYLIGFWYRTDNSYGGNKLAVDVSPAAITFPTVPAFSSTDGKWQFETIAIEIPATPIELTVIWQNNDPSDVFLDDIFICPMSSELGAHVYEPDFMYVSASHMAPGKTSRTLRTSFHQLLGEVGYNNKLSQLSVGYKSRQQNASFNSADPNTTLGFDPALGGTAANFRDGGEYANEFNISNLGMNWEVQGDSLVHNLGSSSDTIEADFCTSSDVETVAMYLEINPNGQNALSDPFTIACGNYTFTWTPGTKEWSGSGPGPILPMGQLYTPRNILLLRGNGIIMLFSDGHLIGSYTESVSGNVITFNTGMNELVVTNLISLANSQLKVSYSDGTTKVVQIQDLHGRDTYVTQAIHDSLGRDVAMTKPMPFSFQNNKGPSGAAQPVAQYRNGVVDLGAFLIALQGDGIMTGDVADFYMGDTSAVQSWQAEVITWGGGISYNFTPGNDYGYPYSRKHYEASPLGRVIEKGLPGKLSDGTLLAIDLTQGADLRHTVQYTYGNDSQLFTIPSEFTTGISSYFVASERQPLKSRKVQMKDQQGILISTLIYKAGEIVAEQYSQSFDTYYASGKISTERSPNYFSTNSDRQSTNFVTELRYDLLGLVIQLVQPDTGTTQYLYDALGRLRFELPDQGTAPDKFTRYTQYDNLNHIIVNGTLDDSTYPWASLSSQVNDESFPTSNQSILTRSITYNDQGNSSEGPQATGINEIAQVITNNYRTIAGASINLEVTELFCYLITEEVSSIVTNVSEVNGNSTPVGNAQGYRVGYSYNNLGNITAIDYPTGVGESLAYAYDEMGREVLANYGDATSGGLSTAIQYTATENPSKLSMNAIPVGGLANQVADLTYSYLGPDWLKSGKTPLGTNLGIKTGDYTYNANGRQVAMDLSFDQPEVGSGTPSNYALNQQYTFDEARNRLTDSTDSSNPPLDVSSLEYDENGNILSMNQASEAITWDFQENATVNKRSDLLSGISSSTVSIENNERGQMTQGPNNADTSKTNVLTYDPSFGLTASVAIDTTQVSFAYGSQGQRVLKRIDVAGNCSSNLLYISPGSHQLSTINLEDNTKSLNFVYDSSNSLLGVTLYNEPYLPVSDQRGTVMAWLNANGELASSFMFFPFGLVQASNALVTGVPVVYAGQEFDAETGMYNFRQRFYDPALRRFTSPDQQRQFESPFVYAGNDPIANIDPSGDVSGSAIAGFVLSGLEIGIGVATANPALVTIGVTSLTNTISHKDESGSDFWKNYVESEVGTAIGIGEIAAGGALTVVTGGAAGSIGGATLIGAGVSAVSYSTFHEGDFDWGAYAKAQVIGAVGGFITGGVGAVGGALAGAAELTGGALLAAQVTTGVVAGASSSLAGSAISAAWDHESVNWKSALINAGISGALGGVSAGAFNKVKFGSFKPGAEDSLAKPASFKQFALGKDEVFISNSTPNFAQFSRLAGPVAFNSKKPVINALETYDPESKKYV